MSWLVWPLFALLLLAVAALLVPWQRWKELFVTALIGGFLLTFVLNYMFAIELGAWAHRFPSMMVLGVPVWLGITWFAEVLVFMNYLPERGWVQAGYVGLFALGTALAASFMHEIAIRPLLRGWGVPATFVLAYMSHYAVIGVDVLARGRHLARV
ncbi:MAG: hypothetical protein AB1445_14700 [Bacillota bacterium]